MLTQEEIATMIQKAIKARENAFVPRSNHKIGACILTSDNEYIEGCNVEGIISGLGSCSERVAIDNAVTHGKYEYKALATVDDKIIYPCGACLQYLLEFYQVSGEEPLIVVADLNGHVETKLLSELLPHGYMTEHNLNTLRSYKNK